MSCKSCMESLKKDPLFAVAMVKLWWAMVNLWREQGNTVIMVIYSDHQRSILNVYASVSMYCAGLASTPPVEVHQRPSVCPVSGVNSLDGTRHCQKRKVKPLNNGETFAALHIWMLGDTFLKQSFCWSDIFISIFMILLDCALFLVHRLVLFNQNIPTLWLQPKLWTVQIH